MLLAAGVVDRLLGLGEDRARVLVQGRGRGGELLMRRSSASRVISCMPRPSPGLSARGCMPLPRSLIVRISERSSSRAETYSVQVGVPHGVGDRLGDQQRDVLASSGREAVASERPRDCSRTRGTLDGTAGTTRS